MSLPAPTPIMERCAILLILLPCVSIGVATVQRVLPTVCNIHSFRSILNSEKPDGLIRQRKEEKKTTLLSRSKVPKGGSGMHTHSLAN